MKISNDYWIERGYSKEEAEQLRKPYLKPILHDIDSMVLRYGKVEGEKKYKNIVKKYKESCENNRHNRKTAGYVSLESKTFFIKLYKECRKIGINRDWIYFGIDGSRELFIRYDGIENRGKFFDFAIPKLNLIIEYNGVFWHPRKEEEWKNPWCSFEDAVLSELDRKRLCKNRNYDLFIVWSDDDKLHKIDELTNIIRERYKNYER